MTATIETTAKLTAEERAVVEALGRINIAMDGLRNLAALIQARPDIARSVVLKGYDINLFVGDHLDDGDGVPDRIASLAAVAAEHGATVTQRHNAEYGGVQAMFGPFPLHIYARIREVGRVTTRTVEVADWQPHPALADIAKGADR
jgi:hypothetical protein